MSLATINSWNVNPVELGPLYPFVGWEVLMFLACMAFCIWFMVWKFRSEKAHYTERVQRLNETDELQRALLTSDSRPPETDRADRR